MGSIIFLGVMMVGMYVLLIMPQQRRAKAHTAMMAALDVGDEVLTSAGIYGTIAAFDGETVFLAVNDQHEIKITKSSIAERVVYADAESE